MDCQITLAQTNPRLGDIGTNLEAHVEAIEAALAEQSDLIVFPELSLTGYFLRDQVFELALPLEAAPIQRLKELSRHISIAFGFVERAPDGRCYNSLAFLEEGRVLHVHRKVHLVTYGMFDDAREFAAGTRFEPVKSKHGSFGLLLCEDLWHVSSAYLYYLANVEALIIASAGPGRGVAKTGPGEPQGLESVAIWNTLLHATALNFQTWVVYANRVGWEDGILFAGASRVVDPFGRPLAELPEAEPGALVTRVESDSLTRARYITPLRRDEKPWIMEQALARLREEEH